MSNMNPFLCTDGYKVSHRLMYPKGTSLVYSNFTPRSDKHFKESNGYVISFGQQMVMRQIEELFDKYFFLNEQTERTEYNPAYFPRDKHPAGFPEMDAKFWRDRVCGEIKKEYEAYLGAPFDVSHIEALWNLGYLPIKVKAIPEGTKVPIGVPVLTIYNTLPEFYWLTNFLETLISNLLWKPITSATIADKYRQNLTKWALKTDENNVGFVSFQGHDFSMRGLSGIDSAIQSGLGHATSFLGSDSLPVIYGARKYYDEKDFVVGSVNATEHSVMCAGGSSNGEEIDTFRRLMETFPTGILSVVSDTWDLWTVLTAYMPALKSEIMARDGKLVIRPDSGDPVDIICGYSDSRYISSRHRPTFQSIGEEYNKVGNKEITLSEKKGVIELLWDTFGGTINEQGYKVLDPHIGAIYGDSITLERAEAICSRLADKGFASTNVVLGIGSFTYQYNTRDTFGMAMKATYVEIAKPSLADIDPIFCGCGEGFQNPDCKPFLDGCTNSYKIEGREIFKDPITDDGTKKSAKGLLMVQQNESNGDLELIDQVNWAEENQGELQVIFENGNFKNVTNLSEIRKRITS